MSTIGVISAPTSLGLRPPAPGVVPGTAGAPAALLRAGLLAALPDARGLGSIEPGPYDFGWTADGATIRNQEAIASHARALGAVIRSARAEGLAPLVIGGDCSILIGAGLSLPNDGGVGLVHIDGHTDFRHPGNSDDCGALAGEDLAAAIGLHWPAVADIDGHAPYFPREWTVHIGHRADDVHAAEVRELLPLVIPAAAVSGAETTDAILAALGARPYWLHLDVDVLDPSVIDAVDSPDPGGLTSEALGGLLRALAPGAVGADVSVFDPTLDPDGRQARTLVRIIGKGLGQLGRDAELARDAGSGPGYRMAE